MIGIKVRMIYCLQLINTPVRKAWAEYPRTMSFHTLPYPGLLLPLRNRQQSGYQHIIPSSSIGRYLRCK